VARRTHSYAIRLAVEGGGQVKAELVAVGQSGEQSLKRIESAGDRASGGSRGSAARRSCCAPASARWVARSPASPQWVVSPPWSIARSRRPMPSAGPPTPSVSVSRRCRSCGSPPRRRGRAADPRHGAAAFHPPDRRGGAGHGRSQGCAGADGHCAARPERQPAEQRGPAGRCCRRFRAHRVLRSARIRARDRGSLALRDIT
jgi:hypothetical protein